MSETAGPSRGIRHRSVLRASIRPRDADAHLVHLALPSFENNDQKKYGGALQDDPPARPRALRPPKKTINNPPYLAILLAYLLRVASSTAPPPLTSGLLSTGGGRCSGDALVGPYPGGPVARAGRDEPTDVRDGDRDDCCAIASRQRGENEHRAVRERARGSPEFLWPCSMNWARAEWGSQNCTPRSFEPETIQAPSGEMATEST